MLPVPVGRLHYERIGAFGRNRFPDYRQAAASDITGKHKPLGLTSFRAVEKNGGGAEYVPRIDVSGLYSRDDIERSIVGDAHHEIHRADRVTHSVQRLD